MFARSVSRLVRRAGVHLISVRRVMERVGLSLRSRRNASWIVHLAQPLTLTR